jgi:hypothetical protein
VLQRTLPTRTEEFISFETRPGRSTDLLRSGARERRDRIRLVVVVRWRWSAWPAHRVCWEPPFVVVAYIWKVTVCDVEPMIVT